MEGIRRDAAMSEDGVYRWNLYRRWWHPPQPQSIVTWIMLNPSTADAQVDDPTIRRCIAYSERWGHSALRVVNLFALRSTAPALLRTAADPVGPVNDDAIMWAVRQASLVMAAWGTHGAYMNRDKNVRAMLRTAGVEVHCLGVSRAGYPLHPLYQRADLPPRLLT